MTAPNFGAAHDLPMLTLGRAHHRVGKTLKSSLVSSSRLVPLFETAPCFRRTGNRSAYANKLIQNLTKDAFWPPPTGGPSHISCLVSPVSQRQRGRMQDGDHDDGEQLCVEAVRQVDRPSMQEDREADSHDESVEREARQLQTEQIAIFRRNSAIGSEPGPSAGSAPSPRPGRTASTIAEKCFEFIARVRHGGVGVNGSEKVREQCARTPSFS